MPSFLHVERGAGWNNLQILSIFYEQVNYFIYFFYYLLNVFKMTNNISNCAFIY